ncbi:MAG: carbonic anhydrase [Alphaproteobacteria bacterium]
MTDVIEYIRRHQLELDIPDDTVLPTHEPEMLLIGCVDARLDIIDDIGIPKGKALVMRNIAALVAGSHEEAQDRPIEAATLEFAVDVMKVKYIAVMGHTDCGGIRARLSGLEMPNIQRYLGPLETVHRQIKERGGSLQKQATEMEQAAVRLSLKNLRTYESVRKAEKAGRLKLHGWVICTATQQLMVLNEQTGTFSPMVKG